MRTSGNEYVQFNTSGVELTGSSGNPTTLTAWNLVKMKNCTIDLRGCRGNGAIGADVIEESSVLLDTNAKIYSVTVDPSASCTYGYPTLDNTGI
jgi:hypothetical protein